MKKVISLILLASLVLTLTGCLRKNYSAEISGNYVDNRYHNSLAGARVVRIGDALYFLHSKNQSRVIKLTADGSEQMINDGTALYPRLFRVGEWDGDLYVADGQTHVYDAATGEMRSIPEHLTTVAEEIWMNDRVIDGFVYYLHYEKVEDIPYYSLRRADLTTGEIETLVSNMEQACYIAQDAVYFTRKEGERSLYKYDLTTGTFRLLTENIPSDGYAKLFMEGDELLLWVEHEIFRINLAGECTLSSLPAKGHQYILNTCEGSVYYNDDGSFYRYDLTTGEIVPLCENSVWSCYIVDDRWVYYYTDEHEYSILWRVSQDGAVTEMVYGG